MCSSGRSLRDGALLTLSFLVVSACTETDDFRNEMALNGRTLHYDDTGCYEVSPAAAQDQQADTLPFECGVIIIRFADGTRWSNIRPLLREYGVAAQLKRIPVRPRSLKIGGGQMASRKEHLPVVILVASVLCLATAALNWWNMVGVGVTFWRIFLASTITLIGLSLLFYSIMSSRAKQT